MTSRLGLAQPLTPPAREGVACRSCTFLSLRKVAPIVLMEPSSVLAHMPSNGMEAGGAHELAFRARSLAPVDAREALVTIRMRDGRVAAEAVHGRQ